MVCYTIEQFYSKLCEQGRLEFTKKFRVTIGDQLSLEAPVNQVQSIEEGMRPLLRCPRICILDKSNSFGELAGH